MSEELANKILEGQQIMQQQILQMNGNMVIMQSQMVEMQGQIVQMNGRIDEMQGQIVQINGRLDRIEATVEELKQDIARLKEGQVRLENRLEEVRTEIIDEVAETFQQICKHIDKRIGMAIS